MLYQKDWRDTLEVGSVIKSGRGTFRIVRALKYRKNGILYGITLVIKRCSWTHRAYTCLNRSDLATLGYSKVAVAPRKLKTKMDKTITNAIFQRASQKPYILDCCDVKGIF